MSLVDQTHTEGAPRSAPLQPSNPNHSHVTRGEDDQAWRALAACAGTDPDLWYPPLVVRRVVRKHLSDVVPDDCAACCARCPVLDDCRTWAITSELYGVWAGTSETWRYAERARLGIRLADDDYNRRDPRLIAHVHELHDGGASIRDIADRYDMSARNVWRILAGARPA